MRERLMDRVYAPSGSRDGSDWSKLLQSAAEEWERTRRPKFEAFYNAVLEGAAQLRNGEITDEQFYNALSEPNEPLMVDMRYRIEEAGWEDMLMLDRDKKGKLKVTLRQVGTIPQLVGEIGLSENGVLQVDKLQAFYDDGIRVRRVRDFVIRTDVGDMARNEARQQILDVLRNVVPLEKKPPKTPRNRAT